MPRLLQFIALSAGLIGCSTTLAAEVRMAFGVSLPPYVISQTDSGAEVDLIREALAYRGHTLAPVYVPLARVRHLFEAGEVDAVQRDKSRRLEGHGAHYADTSIHYQSALITLTERNLILRKPEDLDGLTVLAFQGAAEVYVEWLAPVRRAGNYKEENNQIAQVKTLQASRYDAVWSDINIFRYFTEKVRKEGNIAIKDTTVHTVTEPNPYQPAFRDARVRDDFNTGLRALRNSGRYRQILDTYGISGLAVQSGEVKS